MVGKKIPNPGKSNALSARIQRLADYIDAPENTRPKTGAAAHAAHAAQAARVEGLADDTGRAAAEPARQKCIYGGVRGFQTTSHAARKAEMLALAQTSAHSKDPINHYVLSWPAGEQPTPAQVEKAVDIFLDELGLAGHQAFYGLHADTDNPHLHLMINRVQPVTRKAVEINKGFDLEALHRAVARIEHIQGWRREACGRYRVQADGTLRRDRRPPLDSASTDAQRVHDRLARRYGGSARSAMRIAAEDGAPAIRAAANWADLHARLAARGLRYARAGSGALLWVDEVAVKASRAGRDCSLPALERRLGAYQLAPPGLTVAARPPEPDEPETARRAEDHAAREIHQRNPRAAAQARRATQAAECEALRTGHRAERDALFRAVPPGGWRGRGGELNAQRRLLAARQAGERAVLQERQRRARQQAPVQWSDFPGYEDGLAAQTAGTADRQRARLVALEGEATGRPCDIRAFIAVVYDRRVDYRRADDPDGPAGFVDRGHEIAVYAERDRDTVRAALQLAAQKWERFRVEGDAEYRALCTRVAAECGFPLGNPEPQAAIRPAPVVSHATASRAAASPTS